MKRNKQESWIDKLDSWEARVAARAKIAREKSDKLEKFRHRLFQSEELCLRTLAIGRGSKKEQPVFIWMIDGDSGIDIKMAACFINLVVHVYFSIHRQEIINIDAVHLCDGECSQVQGSLHDFKKKNPYREVTDAAHNFMSELEEKKDMAREVLNPPSYGGWPNRYRIN